MGTFFSSLVPATPLHGYQIKYLIPWAVFCALAILVPIYYFNEGRKRFFGSHTLNKWALDRLMNQVWPLGLVGFIIIGAAMAEMSLFSWPLWHALWAVWLLILVGYWGYYFAIKYRGTWPPIATSAPSSAICPRPSPRRRQARARRTAAVRHLTEHPISDAPFWASTGGTNRPARSCRRATLECVPVHFTRPLGAAWLQGIHVHLYRRLIASRWA